MKHSQFLESSTFDLRELLAFSQGTLLEDPPPGFEARLPAPPLLMFDRVTQIERRGRSGRIVGEQDVRLDAWFFQCHFLGDPVQPGALCIDALWQLLGFYLVLTGALGAGRALGCKELDFAGQIRPDNLRVTYELNVLRRSALPDSAIAIADGRVLVDGEEVCQAKGLRAGVFRGLRYADYPNRSPRSAGGILKQG